MRTLAKFPAFVLLCHSASGFRWNKGFLNLLHTNEDRFGSLGFTGQVLRSFHSSERNTSFEGHLHASSPPSCNVDVTVTSSSDKYQKCPPECPLYAENAMASGHCDFRCVGGTASACKAVNPETPVPDLETGECRACHVSGCNVCSSDGSDTCAECDSWFSLDEKGQCHNKASWCWILVFSLVGLLVFLVVAWIVNLSRRTITNNKGLTQGLELRSLSKLRQPAQELIESGQEDSQEHRPPFEIDTNLCTTLVAGPGILLDFNYQAFIIFWAIAVAVAWAIMAGVVDTDLFVLGTRKGTTARQLCIVVGWGYETQQRLMYSKVGFVIVLYITTFVATLIHSIRQLYLYRLSDENLTTHKDFVIRCTGLPQFEGKAPAEKILKEHFAKATDKTVIGVTLAWEYFDDDELVMRTVTEDLAALATDDQTLGERSRAVSRKVAGDESQSPRSPRRSPSSENTEDGDIHKQLTIDQALMQIGVISWIFTRFEAIFIHPTTQKLISKGRQNKARKPKSRLSNEEQQKLESDQDEMLAFLHGVKSSDTAYIIFNSEDERDSALKTLEEQPQEFKGCPLDFHAATYEPDSILWKNFQHHTTFGEKATRLGFGILVIVIALLAWTFIFYLPYAWFVSSSNYKYGQEPGFAAGMTFSMIVVAGNAIMYLTCAEVADRMHFRYAAYRELCYLFLYAFACFFNVLLDLVFAYYIAYWMMVGSGLRTYGGVQLADLDNFHDRFESYAMQRELGSVLYAYCVPSTFLIPFLIEPIATIYAPYKLMSFIVRSHPELTQTDSEGLLTPIPMDLSRYADIWLNVMLGVLIFFFPGGFVVSMFVVMAISHMWIYLFDHYRVLRAIPKCYYSTMQVDWWATWMMGFPIGCLLCCAIFKANCASGVDAFGNTTPPLYCKSGGEVNSFMALAFIGNMILFTIALCWIGPLFVKPMKEANERETEGETFPHIAKRLPPSYFNTNPMHCLRSEWIFEHDPPIDFCLSGREHYMRYNPTIGAYFHDTKAAVEDYKNTTTFTEAKLTAQKVSKKISGKITHSLSSIKSSVSRDSVTDGKKQRDSIQPIPETDAV